MITREQKDAELLSLTLPLCQAFLLLAAEQAGLARAKQNMYEKRGRRRSADEGVGRELVANLPTLCEFKARSRLTHAHSDGALPVAHEARRPWGGGTLPPIAPWMAAGAGTEVSDDTSHAVHAPRAEGGASPTNAVQVSPQGRRDEGRR